MSDDVNIHLWRDPNTQHEGVEILGHVLESVAVPKHSDNGKLLTRFQHIRVFDTSFSKVVLDEAIGTNDVAEVLARLEPYAGSRVHYQVTSVFDCFHFEAKRRQLERWIKPLTINYYGPEYGWKGFEYKSYGPVRLDFSNTKTFLVPHTLLDHVKETAENGGDTTEGLKMIAKLGKNFDAVSSVAKRVINRLDPTHLLICTELEVNPLTAHAIYHAHCQDYSKDLERIARLHEYGGVYFCDVTPDDPAFRGPRKSPPDYGYLRAKYGDRTEENFVEAIQSMMDEILRNPERLALAKDQIENCFQNLSDTEVEKLNNSYYLSVTDPPFAYLEEPYFRLYGLTRDLQIVETNQ